MLEDGSNLASRMNITPSMPAFGTNMASEHDAMVQVLKAKSGDAFDRAYLEHEVQLHEDVMKRLDEVSIDARHPELKTYLTQARAAIQAHMKRAYDLQRSIMADTAPARGIRSDIR
jgi:putative membrane protein